MRWSISSESPLCLAFAKLRAIAKRRQVGTMSMPSPFTAVESASCCKLIDLAFAEDFGGEAAWRGDLTSLFFIPAGEAGSATMVARSPGVIAGLPAVELVLAALSSEFRIERQVDDGASAPANTRP